VVEYERGNGTDHAIYSGSQPNGALAALLRCIIYQLGVDVAMVSLLDDHTQYFVSGASRHNVRDMKITMGECFRSPPQLPKHCISSYNRRFD
jgi:hypothetical protein